MTSLLGIAGALVGGFLYALIQGESAQPFSLSGNNWYGWIVSILGAVLLIWVWPGLNSRRSRI
ncbi:MAG TPA: GlsB/YeaQ/YmgE family stress response membrane protein, partial [Planctomycetaceae bacterium]|nr:GlsB/YeaQ/YmgE family stress response membrane protein [Planctomycetaceae bacterium]